MEEREGRKRMVTLLQLSSWSPGELPHPTFILSLVELLSKTQRNKSQQTYHHHLQVCCLYHITYLLLNLLIYIHLCSVIEWGGQGHSSVSILSWRDSRQRVWLNSSRLSNLLVSRELILSLMLYVSIYIFICLLYLFSSFSYLVSLSLSHILFL